MNIRTLLKSLSIQQDKFSFSLIFDLEN